MLADGLRWVKAPLSFAHGVDYLCGVDVAVGGAVEVFAEGDGRFGFKVADLREMVLPISRLDTSRSATVTGRPSS
jgi:hypothetical protein